MALIRIDDIPVKTIIGVRDAERKKKQEVLVSIEISYDSSNASASDDINDALDYDLLAKKVVVHVKGSKYFLMEKLAQSILELIMREKNVISAKVTVQKLHALPFTKGLFVEVRSDG